MIRKHFNINYEFDREEALKLIDDQVTEGGKGYVVVADGVILSLANRKPDYLEVVNSSMFSVCDSSFVPVYIRWIHGLKVRQYCGSDIFADIVGMKKYRMAFLGARQETLDSLRDNLSSRDAGIKDMLFYELPFLDAEGFDYEGIAAMLNDYDADIIWVSLGAPKQEYFMNRLLPHLKRGVMIAVGAAFNFYSGRGENRAPKWMLDHHLEFIYRIGQNPKKQLRRCFGIVLNLPGLLYAEWRLKRNQKKTEKYGKEGINHRDHGSGR